MVGNAGCFSGGVHGPYRGAHVDTAEVELAGEDIAERRTARHIGMIDEILAFNSRVVAKRAEHGGAVGVGHVLAVGVDLDHRSATYDGMIGGIILVGIVGMPGVGVVGRD